MVIVVYVMLGIVFRWLKFFFMNVEFDKYFIYIGYELNFFFKFGYMIFFLLYLKYVLGM